MPNKGRDYSPRLGRFSRKSHGEVARKIRKRVDYRIALINRLLFNLAKIFYSMKSKKRVSKSTYTEEHAKSGLTAKLPQLETWPNQYPGYQITIDIPEYTAICPKTGLPDFGTIQLTYVPDQSCIELKSLKVYIHAYRNIGIFYENAVNKILADVVKVCKPVSATVIGDFTARGGLSSTIQASYP